MENEKNDTQQTINQIYEYAADLLVNQKKSASQTQKMLVEQGLDEAVAAALVSKLTQQIQQARKSAANKNMIYGALWCIGGIVATAANLGYVFWGAIVFGAIQFFNGVINSND